MTKEMFDLSGEYYFELRKPNTKKAIKWLKIAAEAAYPQAEYALAQMYLNNVPGVSEETSVAVFEENKVPKHVIKMLKHAAKHGCNEANIALSNIYSGTSKTLATEYMAKTIMPWHFVDSSPEEYNRAKHVFRELLDGKWFPQSLQSRKNVENLIENIKNWDHGFPEVDSDVAGMIDYIKSNKIPLDDSSTQLCNYNKKDCSR